MWELARHGAIYALLVVVLGLFALGMVLLWAGQPLAAGEAFQIPAAWGAFVALGMFRSALRQRSLDEERDRIAGLIPVSIQQIDADDHEGERTMAVTRQNGDVSIVTLPADYHPAQDDGKLLFQSVLPPDVYDKLEVTARSIGIKFG